MINRVVNLQIKNEHEISGNLIIPEKSTGIVIFAHGSGSTGASNRNQVLSKALNNNGFSTLLFDLLTEGEKQIDIKSECLTQAIPGMMLNKFNIKLLTQRLVAITEWIQKNSDTSNLDIGYFGASTGTAAALYAVTAFGDIKLLISRSGRTDLVDKTTLSHICCPCLFIVGQNDKKVIDYNKKTIHLLKNVDEKKVQIVTGASHLFEQQQSIKDVADLSVYWCKKYLKRA